MRFDYPSDWTANELENEVEFEITRTDPFTAVAVRTNPVRLSTADDVLKSIVNELRIFGQFGNFEILETESTSLGGQNAERATISYQLGPDSSYESLLIAAVVGSNSYVINFVAAPSEFDILMPAMQRIMDSFEFIGLSG